MYDFIIGHININAKTMLQYDWHYNDKIQRNDDKLSYIINIIIDNIAKPDRFGICAHQKNNSIYRLMLLNNIHFHRNNT